MPGTGKSEYERSKPGYGWPGFPELPAPLSNRTRTYRLRLERGLGEAVRRLQLDRVERQRHPLDTARRLEDDRRAGVDHRRFQDRRLSRDVQLEEVEQLL